jgi:hypothetical protein
MVGGVVVVVFVVVVVVVVIVVVFKCVLLFAFSRWLVAGYWLFANCSLPTLNFEL